MTKAEKIFDKIIGTLLFLLLLFAFAFGIVKVSSTTEKIIYKSKIPDSIKIECAHCGWVNKRSLMEFSDTIKPKQWMK